MFGSSLRYDEVHTAAVALVATGQGEVSAAAGHGKGKLLRDRKGIKSREQEQWGEGSTVLLQQKHD